MTQPDIPTRTLLGTPQQHLDDSLRLNGQTKKAVYSGDSYYGGNLQSALDDAATLKRPLIIAPGSYNLTSGLSMNGLNDVHVYARGVTLNATADMASLLEMKDCVDCSWFGGRFKVNTGRTVPNVIYIYRETLSAIHNTVDHAVIEGDYSVGLRVGKQLSGASCDHIFFNDVRLIGTDKADQIGIYAGDGINGNCLNLSFNNIMCNRHETHIKVDKTNAYFSNVFLDTCTTDFIVDAVLFSLRNVRSESASRFLSTGGPSSSLGHITIEDVWWNGESINTDGEWIQHRIAGYLKLDNVKCINAGYAPVVRSYAPAATVIKVDGLSTIATSADAFVHDSNTVVKGDYIQHDSNKAVVSITEL